MEDLCRISNQLQQLIEENFRLKSEVKHLNKLVEIYQDGLPEAAKGPTREKAEK